MGKEDNKETRVCFLFHSWGKWELTEDDSLGEGKGKDRANVGWIIRQKRVCNHCGKTQIQSQSISN